MIPYFELNDFYNDGFGWICRHCEQELREKESAEKKENKRSRLMSEGEAESKQPALSNLALARWTDKTQTILMCPRCGITELADKS